MRLGWDHHATPQRCDIANGKTEDKPPEDGWIKQSRNEKGLHYSIGVGKKVRKSRLQGDGSINSQQIKPEDNSSHVSAGDARSAGDGGDSNGKPLRGQESVALPSQEHGDSKTTEAPKPPEPPIEPKNEPPTAQNTETAGDEDSKKSDGKLDRDMVFWTRAVGIFTALLFLSSVLQYCAMRGQQAVMQGQLDEMQSEQRPWIYSDTPIILDQIHVQENGWWDIDLKFSVHNIGNLPAKFVFIQPAATAVVDMTIIQKKQDFTCHKELPPNSVGTTVFPGQNFDYTIDMGISSGDLEAAYFSGSRPNIVLYGCMIYQFPTGNQQHFSSFVYLVDFIPNTQEGTNFPMPIDPSNVPVENLKILPWISGNSFDAN